MPTPETPSANKTSQAVNSFNDLLHGEDMLLGKELAEAIAEKYKLMERALKAFKKWDEAEGEKSPKSTTFDERCGLYALAAEQMEFALAFDPLSHD